MKKLFLLVSLIAAVSFCASAQDANTLSYISIYQPTNVAVVSAGRDISLYKGNAAFVCSYGPGAAAYTNTVLLEHSINNSTFETITNLAGIVANFATVIGTNEYRVVTYPIDLARLHKYVRATVTMSAANGASTSVILAAPMKSQ